LITVSLVALALLLAGALAATAMHSYLLDQIDAELMRTQGRTPAPPPPAQTGTSPLPSDFYIAFNDESGATIQQVSNLPDGSPAPAPPALTRTQVVDLAGRPFTADGWRVLATPTATGSVLVAKSLAEVDATVTRLVALETGVGLVVLVAVASLSVLVVRRSLRPLGAVARTAGSITGGDLSARVRQPDPRTEAGAVAEALNTMLDSVETSSAQREAALAVAQTSETRMRQFVADASHELRTPLTSIRGTAQLYRQGAIGDEEVDGAFGRIEDQSDRMGALIEELLLLARLDSRRPLDEDPVDMLAVCSEAVDAVTLSGRSIGLRMAPGSSAAMVTGDALRLRQVIDNLVANAITHGRGDIEIEISTPGTDVVVMVTDEGPGVGVEDASRVFDRFYRAGTARSRKTGGSGLGLSIVSSLVAAHGGTVSVDHARFEVRLPRAGSG
jgi:two-component system OmpR family sensor kinase